MRVVLYLIAHAMQTLLIVSVFVTYCLSANPATLVLLKNAVQDGARCIDGSPPAYYIQKGWGSGASKWQIHHEGGGWCTSLSDCAFRATTQRGSSKSYPVTTDLIFGYLSNNETENPMMYNWNKVYLKYCDGASFSGYNFSKTTHNGTELYFRGFLNLQAYHKSLSTDYNLNKATDVVISGCSAGGLATYLHLDWWVTVLPSTVKVVGLADSGFFLDYNSESGKPDFATQMRWVFQQNNASIGVNQECIKKNSKNDNCFFAEYSAPHVKTPLFALQSVYDAWQVSNILGSSNTASVNAYGEILSTRFKANVLSNPANGAFLDSCLHHCHGWFLSVNGFSITSAFSSWYSSGSGGVQIQGKPYPCSDCCAGECGTCFTI